MKNNSLTKIWYMICFAFLGLIDQRRGSAPGEVQMMFSNMTGIVIALMLVPSLDLSRFKARVYLIWTPVCLVATIALCLLGRAVWPYPLQWISGVLNFTVWSYLAIYLIKERRQPVPARRKWQPFWVCLLLMVILMQVSVREGIVPLWYLVIFGGFYLIGIPKENWKEFFDGMLNGIILWFFVQQIIAFGFRPYDYVRYRGLYSGETQNGLFYMMAYCAFLIKWIWAKEKKAPKLWSWIYFILSASCISFIIYTGGRAPLLGAGAVTFAVYVWYDLVYQKRFLKWLLHCAALGLCIVLTFPVVYGAIRYFPVILHHPVWFADEYDQNTSVHSYDPWNSNKYISFEQAVESNVGRILSLIGIDVNLWRHKLTGALTGLKVYAAESAEELDPSEPGDSPDNPFMLEDTDKDNSVSVRKAIYAYYWNHLNIAGHSVTGEGFYLTKDIYYGHAHNMFLQMAYNYGIPVGLLFTGLYLYSLLQVFWRKRRENVVCAVFLLAIFAFGMAEMAVIPGQITVAMIGIMFYFIGCSDEGKYGNLCDNVI